MPAIVIAQLVTVCAYAGFQWTVHVLVYPQLAQVPPESFPAYERSHQRRVSYVVGPLFGALSVTTALLCLEHPSGLPVAGLVASLALLIALLAVTGLLAVPLHRRLDAGWDRAAHRKLTHVDTIRVAVATVNVVVTVLLAAKST
jgi:Domain of unknown function (DUF1772)